jgi:hypothetical protein
MAKKYTLYKNANVLEITMGKIWTQSQRIGIVAFVLFFLLVAISYLMIEGMDSFEFDGSLIGKVVILCCVVITLGVTYQLLKQLFYSETIKASLSHIEILKQNIFLKTSIVLPLIDITGITLVDDAQNKTEHPLAKNTGDVFGFGANEAAIAHINNEGKIAIVCGIDTPIICGKGLPSWEAAEVIKELGVFCEKPYYEDDGEVWDVGEVEGE